MTPTAVTLLFVASTIVATSVRFWLLLRHRSHVLHHRNHVPEAFSSRVELSAHQKAADYSGEKTRLACISLVLDIAFLLVMTLGGGLDLLASRLSEFSENQIIQGLILFGTFGLISSLYGMPLDWYQTFVIEQRFGFNKQTLTGWLFDGVKGLLVSLVIGTPLLAAILWFMSAFADIWWLYAWGLWMGFNLVLLWAYPVLIAPLFNTFKPLADADLAQRLDALLARCGFRASGVFVMDGSRRSAHGNAYFTGFGAAKRIVLFDTLLAMLTPAQIEAVLAHELGHFVHRHVIKRLFLAAVTSFAGLWLISVMIGSTAFFSGLGVSHASTALGLLLAGLWLPSLSFPFSPLLSFLSRHHEYEADRYAATQSSATHLVDALVAMYRENAATLTPDPLHSLFFDSHPPATLRISQLETAAGAYNR